MNISYKWCLSILLQNDSSVRLKKIRRKRNKVLVLCIDQYMFKTLYEIKKIELYYSRLLFYLPMIAQLWIYIFSITKYNNWTVAWLFDDYSKIKTLIDKYWNLCRLLWSFIAGDLENVELDYSEHVRKKFGVI